MFATQQYMNSLPDDNARKRAWEGEHVNLGSFADHRNKRHQCLPLRNSPPSPQQSDSVTPLESNSEHFINSRTDAYDGLSHEPLATPPPSRLSHQDNTRIPTPIQPSFAAQVRGQQSGFSSTPDQQNSIPRSLAHNAPDWHQVQNNRRLPSPISEDAAAAATAAGSPGMIVDCGSQEDDPTSNQLSARLRKSSISQNSHDAHFHGNEDAYDAEPHEMEHPNAMDFEAHSPLSHTHTSEMDPESPSPSRKGHMRSKHTINTWTWQPGMKRSFSMGYRQDCEKCRAKVPGHFNHIIIS